MITEETKAAGLVTTAARQSYTQTNNKRLEPSPQCGKAAAVALFNFNLLPLESVSRLFARNPTWRAA